jgi:hypothetical protein
MNSKSQNEPDIQHINKASALAEVKILTDTEKLNTDLTLAISVPFMV